MTGATFVRAHDVREFFPHERPCLGLLVEDGAEAQVAERSDLHASGDSHVAADRIERVDRHVLVELHAGLDPVDAGSTMVTPASMCASLIRCLSKSGSLGELDAGVDAERELRVHRLDDVADAGAVHDVANAVGEIGSPCAFCGSSRSIASHRAGALNT